MRVQLEPTPFHLLAGINTDSHTYTCTHYLKSLIKEEIKSDKDV